LKKKEETLGKGDELNDNKEKGKNVPPGGRVTMGAVNPARQAGSP